MKKTRRIKLVGWMDCLFVCWLVGLPLELWLFAGDEPNEGGFEQEEQEEEEGEPTTPEDDALLPFHISDIL